MLGTIAETTDFNAERVATQLGQFLRTPHQPAPTNAPTNEFRGVPLAQRAGAVHERTSRLANFADADEVLQTWHELVATPPWIGPALWLHGDLHPANLLVQAGELSAVIDFGDITSGDPATDLAVAWILFPPEVRATFRSAYNQADHDTWKRAKGWALALSLAYLMGSADNPLIAGIGRRTLQSVLDDSTRP